MHTSLTLAPTHFQRTYKVALTTTITTPSACMITHAICTRAEMVGRAELVAGKRVSVRSLASSAFGGAQTQIQTVPVPASPAPSSSAHAGAHVLNPSASAETSTSQEEGIEVWQLTSLTLWSFSIVHIKERCLHQGTLYTYRKHFGARQDMRAHTHAMCVHADIYDACVRMHTMCIYKKNTTLCMRHVFRPT
jgi:hypothetical protein